MCRVRARAWPRASQGRAQGTDPQYRQPLTDVIATDHAPHSDEEKLKIYPNSPNGITGLETAFSLAYELLGLDKTLEKMAYNPRRILGINNKKMIKVALDEEWVVVPSQFKTKCKISPYKGMKLKGLIIND